MTVSVETEPSLKFGTPSTLFSDESRYGWDVAPDGQHFLVIRDVGEIGNPKIAIIQNWFIEFATSPSAE